MKKSLGLVFSGGGVKSAAELGVIDVLQDHGIKASVVAGTSAGAMTAAFYALGYPAEDILDIYKQMDVFSSSAFTWSKPGMLDPLVHRSHFEPHFAGVRFEDLDVRVSIVATDLLTGKPVVFDKGLMLEPLLASSAFPGFFSPVEIDNYLLCDGGVVNNFPVESVRPHVDKVLGISVNPLKPFDKSQLKRTHQVLDRVYKIASRYTSISKYNLCDWVIEPEEMVKYHTFSTKHFDEIYEIGREYGLRFLERVSEGLSE